MDIANESISSNFLSALVLCSLVDFDRLAIELYHMNDLDSIICIFLRFKLNKPITLRLIGHFISRYVNVHNWTTLQKELPY